MNMTNRILACTMAASMLLANGVLPVSAAYAKGDVNGDGCVNAYDAAFCLKAALNIGAGCGSGLTEAQEAAADVNHSNYMNAEDTTLILKACTQNGVDPSAKTEWSDNLDSVIQHTKKHGMIALEMPEITEENLKKWDYQVPVLIHVESDEPVNSLELCLSVNLPCTVITKNNLYKYKHDPWYSLIDEDAMAYNTGIIHANKNGMVWFACADCNEETFSGNLAVLLLDIPYNQPVVGDVRIIQKTDTRTAFFAKDNERQVKFAEPEAGTSLHIAVNPEKDAKLSITSRPQKCTYEMGEELDLSGCTAFASGYIDGVYWSTFGEIPGSEDFIVDTSAFDSSQGGTYTIRVTSAKDKSLSDCFNVTVKGKETDPE